MTHSCSKITTCVLYNVRLIVLPPGTLSNLCYVYHYLMRTKIRQDMRELLTARTQLYTGYMLT